MKLHLGCGQVYLDGYTNIDFPLTEHTVQEKSVADEYADLRELKYKKNSIDEVRLHHVYEHFPRHIAIALLAGWQIWLKRGGVLHIEVPDFTESAKLVLDSNSLKRDKDVALRHIFGSNEAPWATHYEGWTEENFKDILSLYGFKKVTIKREAYMATRNIIVTAQKGLSNMDSKKAHDKAKTYLKNFTVNDSEFELSLLDIWMKEFDDQLAKLI
jgi:predicted SAM-dependent methyltransferase